MVKQEARLLTVPELVVSWGQFLPHYRAQEVRGCVHDWEPLRGGSYPGVAMLLFFGGVRLGEGAVVPTQLLGRGAKG